MNLPETRWARGYYHYYGFQDFDRALAEFEAAARAVPNDAESRQAIGYIHRRKGDLDSAIDNLELAAELDPQDANILINLSTTYRARRQFDKALELADRSLELRPETDAYYFAKASYIMDATGDLAQMREVLDQAPGTDQIAGAFNWIDYHFRTRDFDGLIARMEAIESPNPYVQAAKQVVIAFAKGLRDGPEAARPHLEAARAVIEPILEAAPTNAQLHGWMAGIQAFLGEEDSAIREAELAIELTEKDKFSGLQAVEGLAQIYAGVGRPDEAFELLERLFESDYEGSITVPALELDPAWDALRDDPRYQELIEKYS